MNDQGDSIEAASHGHNMQLILFLYHLNLRTFHPKIDEKTEVTNQILVNLVRCLAGKHVKRWDIVLSQAEFSYNNSIKESQKRHLLKLHMG